MIEVKLFAYFRNGRGKSVILDSDKVNTVKDIVDTLSIDIDDVQIMLVNGRHKKPNDIVSDGDLVSLFPPVAGG